MEEAQKFKEAGNEAFKEKHFNSAIQFYTKSLEIHKDPLVLGNRAQAEINAGLYLNAQMDCTEAISMDPTISKNFYRRAMAYKHIGIYEEAERDLIKCLELTQNQAASAMLLEVQRGKNPKIIEMCVVERDDFLASNEEFIDVEIMCDNPVEEATTSSKQYSEKKEVPKNPTTFGDFSTSMTHLIDEPIVAAKYFLQIDENRYHYLFDDLINNGHASQILLCLSLFIRTCPQSAPSMAAKLLKLAEVERFDMIIMMLGKEEKNAISEISNWCSKEDAELLLAKYL